MAFVKFKKIRFSSSVKEEELKNIPGYYPGDDPFSGYIEENSLSGLNRDVYELFEMDPSVDNPPVKLENASFFKPFERFSLKNKLNYFGNDPTIFISVCFCILFGLMFGDIGQGLILLVIGLLSKKKDNRIFVSLSVFSIFFGFVYGSFFGNEELLPELLSETSVGNICFGLLEREHTLVLLQIAALVGALMILGSIVFNVINHVKNNTLKKVFFANNGIAGLVTYGSIVICSLITYFVGFNLPTIIIGFILLALGNVMLFKYENSLKYNWESVVGFASSIMNFLLVGCFALVHATLMYVVYHIAAKCGFMKYPIIVLGNIFVIALESEEVFHQSGHLVFDVLMKYID